MRKCYRQRKVSFILNIAMVAGVVICLVLFAKIYIFENCQALETRTPVSWTSSIAIAQDEVTILRKAERKIDHLVDFTVGQSHEKARSFAILAIAEQLKRIADALERR